MPAAALLRSLGPWLPSHRTALANLRAAFPDRSEAEIGSDRAIRLGQSRPHRRRIRPSRHAVRFRPRRSRDPAHAGRRPRALPRAARRRPARPDVLGPPRPTGNCRRSARPSSTSRRPRCSARRTTPPPPASSRRCGARPWAAWPPPARAAPSRCRACVERGGHLGQLIDQHFTRGVVVSFFGRPCLANPLLGKLARHYDCPVHGARVVRLPNGRFRLELTPPLDLPRDADGSIEVAGAMQAMTAVVEGWVRENPGQWLWMHRRWRPNMLPKAAGDRRRRRSSSQRDFPAGAGCALLRR